jgi:integrase
LCNKFLTAKKHQLDNGEITKRTFEDYHATCDRLIGMFGKGQLVEDLGADDFAALRADMSKTWGVVRLGNEITRVRVVFNHAYQNQLIEKPVRYGSAFKRPSKKVLRIARAKNGPRMFEAEDVRRMLEAANPQMRAMFLLGINAGLGNHDCGSLPIAALDLDGGWLNYPRVKTGVPRRCPLWPETVAALREVLEARPKPKNEADAALAFITQTGGCSWAKDTRDNPITKETVKILKAIGIHRKGLAFYALRHTFETIGGGCRDQVAVNHIMGHADDSMAAAYRERIDDSRLRAVAEHVRSWLWPEMAEDKPAKPERKRRKAKKAKPKLRIVG